MANYKPANLMNKNYIIIIAISLAGGRPYSGRKTALVHPWCDGCHFSGQISITRNGCNTVCLQRHVEVAN